MSINVNLDRKDKTVDIHTKSSIKDPKVFIDWITELGGISMGIEDTLEITWDVDVGLYVDDVLHDIKKIKIRQIFKPKKEITVRFARFVHYKNKSKIFIYDKLPKVGFPND